MQGPHGLCTQGLECIPARHRTFLRGYSIGMWRVVGMSSDTDIDSGTKLRDNLLNQN